MAELENSQTPAGFQHAAKFLEAGHPVSEVANAEADSERVKAAVWIGQVLTIGADPIEAPGPLSIITARFARFEHGIIDVANNRCGLARIAAALSGCIGALQEGAGKLARAACNIEMALTRLRVEFGHRVMFPQAVNAHRHEIIHHVILARNRPEDALHAVDFLVWGHGFEAERDGFGLSCISHLGLSKHSYVKALWTRGRRLALIRPQCLCSLHGMGVRTHSLNAFRAVNADARHWQILALASLFSISWLSSDFGAKPINLALAIFGALIAQLGGTIWVNLRAEAARRAPGEGATGNHWMRAGFRAGFSSLWNGFQWKSALITALSLSILLRATSPWFWLAAGLIAISAKFLIRFNGKHIFNPACIGIVVLMLVFGREAWVSPGQWGQAPLLAGYAIAVAALVLSSAKRLDIALGFLGTFAVILVARAMWLGDPMTIPMHQLSSGALLIFAFFMITDPRSTPDSRAGRIVFAMCVASLAAWFMIGPNVRGAPLMALAALAFLTPILDRVLPAKKFQWISKEGHSHETDTSGRRLRARPRFHSA